ncbi:MAG: hypothetical protein Q9161_004841 [Pseudevernia consocians]
MHASETPMNISDYVNLDFDFDFEAIRHRDDVPSEASVPVGSLHGMSIDHMFTDGVGSIDTEFTGLFQLFDGSNALGDSLTTTGSQRSSEQGSSHDAREALIADPTLLSGLSVAHLDSEMTDAFNKLTEINAPFGDYTAIDLGVESLGMADASQTTNEREPSVWVPTDLKSHQHPSGWVPVSQELQQHLNTVYASQLARNLASAHPAPVLYFPAQDSLVSPVSSIQSLLSGVHSQLAIPPVCQPGSELSSIDPSVLMHESTATSPQKRPLNNEHSSTSPAEDPAFFPIKKRAINASESDSEPVPKRIQTAQEESLLTVVKDGESGDELKESDDQSEDDTMGASYDEYSNSNSSGRPSTSPSPILPPTTVTRKGSSPPRNNPSVKKGPYWRYEQVKEVHLRNQRREKWNGRRAKHVNAKGEAYDRNMQRLLEEIEDTEEFAEAQGYKVTEKSGNDKDQDLVRRRPVRKGARKSYVGQE